MPNPFARSRAFHKIGNVTNTPVWKVLPTPNGLALVTTLGRKSGRKRPRAMRVVRLGDSVYAVAMLGRRSDWLANVRADPNVTIKLGSTTYRATARELTHPAELARAAETYRPVVGWYDYFDYANLVWDLPTRSKLLRAHDEWFEEGIPVVFELRGRA
jgi:deazaflavin-dependent oxidoreductase (nitroreductase family)